MLTTLATCLRTAIDLLEMKLDEATVVTVYLLPEAIAKVQPMLHACLERGGRVVFNSWGLDPAQYLLRAILA